MGTLRWVVVKQTKVTAEGVKKLHAALPLCKIEWDGGVIEPKSPPTSLLCKASDGCSRRACGAH